MKKVFKIRFTNKINIKHGFVCNETNHYSILLPFLVVISSMLVKVVTNLYKDSDPFWSIAVGKWISQHGTVPYIDYFSWTVNGKPWIAMEWLFCWLLYSIEQYFGYLFIPVMIFIVYLATAYLMFVMCRQLNQSSTSVWIFAVCMWSLVYYSATPRAYIFTFLFLAVMLYLLHFQENSKLYYIIPLVFLFWINIQSSAILGVLMLFVEALIGSIVFNNKKIWPIACLSLLATLVNPYGFAVWTYVYDNLFLPANKMYIQEWGAPNFNNYKILILYIVIGFAGVAGTYKVAFIYNINKKLLLHKEVMIFLWFWVSYFYSLMTVRMVYYSIFFLTLYFVAFIPKWIQKRFKLNPVIIVSILGLFTSFILLIMSRLPMFVPPAYTTPVEAVNYLKKYPYLQDKMFNQYGFGGYLIMKDIKVFIDGRGDVYASNNVLQDYMDLSLLVRPEEIIKKYGIETFLLIPTEPLAVYLNGRPGWKKQFEDNCSIIFTKEY